MHACQKRLNLKSRVHPRFTGLTAAVSKNLWGGALAIPTPLGWGVADLALINTPLPTCVTCKIGHSRSNDTNVITEILQKKNPPFASPPFKVTRVIGNDAD